MATDDTRGGRWRKEQSCCRGGGATKPFLVAHCDHQKAEAVRGDCLDLALAVSICMVAKYNLDPTSC